MKSKVRVLLIIPNYWGDIFKKSKAKVAVSRTTMSLGLAVIAAPIIEKGYDVQILDLNSSSLPVEKLSGALTGLSFWMQLIHRLIVKNSLQNSLISSSLFKILL